MDDRERRISEATALFADEEGTWDAEVVVTPPGAPPNPSRGVATMRTIAGGRWLVMDYRSDQGFEGHGIYGFDPDLGRYVGSWVDAMQTSIARLEGEFDPATKTMSYVTTTTARGKPFTYREVTVHESRTKRVYRNLIPMPGGAEHELMRITYTKR
jgi:hypothetical protein